MSRHDLVTAAAYLVVLAFQYLVIISVFPESERWVLLPITVGMSGLFVGQFGLRSLRAQGCRLESRLIAISMVMMLVLGILPLFVARYYFSYTFISFGAAGMIGLMSLPYSIFLTWKSKNGSVT